MGVKTKIYCNECPYSKCKLEEYIEELELNIERQLKAYKKYEESASSEELLMMYPYNSIHYLEEIRNSRTNIKNNGFCYHIESWEF